MMRVGDKFLVLYYLEVMTRVVAVVIEDGDGNDNENYESVNGWCLNFHTERWDSHYPKSMPRA